MPATRPEEANERRKNGNGPTTAKPNGDSDSPGQRYTRGPRGEAEGAECRVNPEKAYSKRSV